MRELLKSLNIKFEENNKEIIKPLELDFYIPEFNLAIELNGNYWHSEVSGEKNKHYHVNKTKQCLEKNIKLIHVFEDEWLLKNEIVKSRVSNLVGKIENKIYARNCSVVEINNTEKTEFLEKNHIQGNSVDKIRLGLKLNNEIVSVMTFSKNRVVLGLKNKEGEYELIRFCSKINSVVIGGFDKLFKYFIKHYKVNQISTYADCRWSGMDYKSSVYLKLGFKFVSITPPSYFYMLKKDYLNRKHRFSFAKHNLLRKFGGDPLMTEWEIAQNNGYDRIWDCGTMRFKYST